MAHGAQMNQKKRNHPNAMVDGGMVKPAATKIDQLKDPKTYFDLITLGKELTQADEKKIWDDNRINQEKILSKKKIKHRNFGEYSKHNCGYEDCPYNGIMIKQGSGLSESHMWFETDKKEGSTKEKAKKIKKQRKNSHKIIRDELDY